MTEPVHTDKPNAWLSLRQQMQDVFDFQELHEFCFDLGVDYENLGEGLGKSERIIKLIGHMVRHGRLSDLLTALRQVRPHFTWPDETDLPQTADGEPLLDAPAAGQLYNVLPLPPNYLPRPEEFNQLKVAVLKTDGASTVVHAHIVGLQGMGGIGKSVLAAALAWDDDLRHHFADGTFWLSIGQSPVLETRQKQIVDALEPGTQAFHDVQEGRAQLSRILAHKQCLVILDDVWELEHATAFDVLAQSQSCLLITTRNASLLEALGAAIHQVKLLDNKAALTLLAQAADVKPEQVWQDKEAQAVAAECGHLPLALAMVGGMVRGKPKPWNRALRRLQRADLSRIKENFPHYPYPDLLRAIQVSVEALGEGLEELDPIDRYIDLAVFAEDTPIPTKVLEYLWQEVGLDDIDVEDLVEAFVSRSLAHLDEAGHLHLHDLHVNYVQQQAGDLKERHERLLAAYQDATEDGSWATGANDGYFFQQLAYHLKGAGRQEELAALLFHFDWLQARLQATDVNGLLMDFTTALQANPRQAAELRLLQETIQLSGHVLSQDANQLAGQLLGRLLHHQSDALTSLFESIQAGQRTAWLRPLTASLTSPGGPLLRTLQAHTLSKSASQGSTLLLGLRDPLRHAIAVTPDSQYILSASRDKTVKMWDWAKGTELFTLTGHRRAVTGVAITPNGRQAVSVSQDKSLKLWDLTRGTELATLTGHTRTINDVLITPDGQYALSAANDQTIKIWQLSTRQEIATLTLKRESLNPADIKTIAITPDGQTILSGSKDGVIRIWDWQTREQRAMLKGHNSWVNRVVVTPDGHHALSVSDDKLIKVWHIATAQEVATLSGHHRAVTAIAVTPDGQYALSTDKDGTIKMWHLTSYEEITSWSGYTENIDDILVTPDGEDILTISESGTVKVWDWSRAKGYVDPAEHAGAVNDVAVTADGQHVLSVSDEGMGKVWHLADQTAVSTLFEQANKIKSIIVMPGGQQVLSADNEGTIQVWHLETQEELVCYMSKNRHEFPPDGLAITPDGQRILSVSGNMIAVLDAEMGDQLMALKWHDSTVNGVEVTPDGKKAVSGSSDGKVKIWDLETGTELMTLPGHTSHVRCIEIMADGQRAISASDDATVKVWHLETGQELLTLAAHTAAVGDTAVMPDQQRIVSTSYDYTVRVWHLETGRLITTFYIDDEGLACDVAPDGTIIVGSANGRLHFLRLENAN